MMQLFCHHQDQVQRRKQWNKTKNKDFGLTVSVPKTKHMITGRLVEEND